MKIVFMGTPVFATGILEALIKKYEVVGVVTQPDKEVGRNKKIKFSPVKEVALKHNIKLFQPKNIKKEYQEILNISFDIIITAAYGQIIPKELLDYPKFKCINVHGSILPKLRGGSPIHQSIVRGYSKTGVTIMYMVSKMDAGDIISQDTFEILDSDTVGSVHDKMMVVGEELLLKTLPNIFSNNIKPIKQNENEVTYAKNIKREEEKLDFNKNCREIFNHIRGFNPWPLTYMIFNNKEMKIFSSRYELIELENKNGEIVKHNNELGIKCNDGIIFLEEVKLAGKRKMIFKDFLNGNKDYFKEGVII